MGRRSMGMKLLLTLLFSLLAVTGWAANPSFTDILQTNILWVAKNGNNSTAKPGSPALKYLTISNAVQAAVKPAVVRVAPGVYNESVNLKDGVDIHLEAGADLFFTSAGSLTTLTDDGVRVTNSVYGLGSIGRFGSTSAKVFEVAGDSRVSLAVKTVRAPGTSINGAIYVSCSTCFVDVTTEVYCGGLSVRMGGGGSSSFRGAIFSTNDYGYLISGDSSNYLSGQVFSWLNSAVSPTGIGYLLIENSILTSSNLYGIEVAGGDIDVRNSRVQSLRAVDGSGNAISKYGGDLMTLDSVQLISGANNVYSIDDQSNPSHGSIQIRGTVWANRPANPEMNITQGGVTVTNAFYFKQEQALASVHGLTNVVLQTNGHTIFPKTIAAGTNTASFTFITTNLLTGQTYTNLSQRGYVVATVTLTNILAGDFSAMSLIVDQNGDGTWDDTNGPVALQGVAALAGQHQLTGVLQPGALFAFTNQSAGTSPSATIRAGSCRWSRW